jgi:LmbE family N-acetylglucosaminyl deacetylase
MKFARPDADFFVPNGASEEAALKRTTHMGIGAHADDLEIMAYHGILECFGAKDKWFFGVTSMNGADSPRSGPYANTTNPEMVLIRRQEQRNAAVLGEYSGMIQLAHPKLDGENPTYRPLLDDLAEILKVAHPQVVYTHNLADKHDAHVSVAMKVVEALRRMPKEAKPKKVYGCEVWRNLDWMHDPDKVSFDVSAHENLAASLLGLFDSQIAGGKRYDLATLGRRRSNATFAETLGLDKSTHVTLAMDLTPLVNDPALDPVQYVRGHVDHFWENVQSRMEKYRVK